MHHCHTDPLTQRTSMDIEFETQNVCVINVWGAVQKSCRPQLNKSLSQSHTKTFTVVIIQDETFVDWRQ